MELHWGPFTAHPTRALHDRRVGHLAYRLLGAFMARADRRGIVENTTQGDLARDIGVRQQEVGRCVGQLEECGYVTISRRVDPASGRRLTNTYQLHLELPDLAPQHDTTEGGRFGAVRHFVSIPERSAETEAVGSIPDGLVRARPAGSPIQDELVTGGVVSPSPELYDISPPSPTKVAAELAEHLCVTTTPRPLDPPSALAPVLAQMLGCGWTWDELVTAFPAVRVPMSPRGWELVLRSNRPAAAAVGSLTARKPLGCPQCDAGFMQLEDGSVLRCPDC